MADNDYVIRAKITGDASSFESSVKGAVAANKAAFDQILSDFRSASSKYKEELAHLAELEKAIGKSTTDPVGAKSLNDYAETVKKSNTELTILAGKLVGINLSSEEAAKGFQLTDTQLKAVIRSAEIASRQFVTLAAIERDAAKEGASLADLSRLQERAGAELSFAKSGQRQAQIALGPAQGESSIAAAGLAQASANVTALEAAYTSLGSKIALVEQQQAQLAAEGKANADAQNLEAEAITRVAAATTTLEARLAALKTQLSTVSTTDLKQMQVAFAAVQTEVRNATQVFQQAQISLGELGTRSTVAANQLTATGQVLGEFQQLNQSFAASFNASKEAQEAAANAATATAEKIAEVTSTATQLEQRFNVMKALIVETAGASLPQLDSALLRVSADMNAAAAAVRQAHTELGVLAQTSPEAAAALATLEATTTAIITTGSDFKASVDSVKDSIEAENAVTAKITETSLLANKATQTRSDTEREAAAQTKASSTELRELANRAAAEARDTASEHARASRIIGDAAKAGSVEAQTALNQLGAAQKQQFALADELAAKSRLLALVEQDAKAKTTEEANALVQLQIAEHGSAVAALEAAEAARAQALTYDKMATSTAAVRLELSALSGTAQGVIYALSRLASGVKALAPILEVAFPVFAAVAFIEILNQGRQALNNLIDSFYGLDKVSKQILNNIGEETRRTTEGLADMHKEIANLQAIGTSGAVKLGIEFQNERRYQAELSAQITDTRKSLNEAAEELKRLSAVTIISGLVAPATLGEAGKSIEAIYERTSGTAKRSVQDLEEYIKNTSTELDKLTDKLKTANEKGVPQIKAEQGAEAFKRRIQDQEDAAQQTRLINEKLQEDQKRHAERMYADKEISNEREHDLLVSANNNLYQSEIDYINKHNELQKQLRATGEHAPDIPVEPSMFENMARQEEIDIRTLRQHNEELRKIFEERKKVVEEGASIAASNAPEGQEKRAELDFLKKQAQPTGNAAIDLTNLAIIGQKLATVTKEASKEAEKEVRESTQQMYENWIESGQRSTQEIIFFWQNVRNLAGENSELVKLATAKIAEETQKLREEQEKLNRALEEEKAIRETGALEQQKLEVQRQYIIKPPVSLNPFGLTPQQKEEQEIGKIELQEIQVKQRSLQRQIQDEEAAGRKGLAEYQKLVNQKEQIDQQYDEKRKQLDNKALQDQLNNIRHYVQQVDQAFFNGVNEWILGQKKFSQAMIDAWKNIVSAVIKDIEEIAAKWIEEHIIMAAIEKILGVSGASKVAAHNTENVLMATSDAAAGAGAAFASVIEALPFPVNVAVAPGVAAEVLATGLGFAAAASAETGGFIPRDGGVMLHQGEVVVNHPVTEMLSNIAERGNAYYDGPQNVVPNASPNVFQPPSAQQTSVSNSLSNISNAISSQTGGDNHVHVHYSPTIHSNGDQSDLKSMLSQHADHIGRIVKRQVKTFNR